jgi:hypothetical protein
VTNKSVFVARRQGNWECFSQNYFRIRKRKPNSNIIIIVMVQEMTSQCPSLAPSLQRTFHADTSFPPMSQQNVTNAFLEIKVSTQAALAYTFLKCNSTYSFNSGEGGSRVRFLDKQENQKVAVFCVVAPCGLVGVY